MSAIRCPHCDAVVRLSLEELEFGPWCPRCNGTITPEDLTKQPKRRRAKRKKAVNTKAAEPASVSKMERKESQSGEDKKTGESGTYRLEGGLDFSADVTPAPPPPVPTVSVGAATETQVADAMSEVRSHYAELPPPPRYPFAQGIWQFPLYRTVVLRWLAVIAGFCVAFLLFGAAAWSANAGPIAAAFGLVVFGLAGFFAWAITMGIAVTQCLAVLAETATGYDQIEDWPDADVRDWLIHLLHQGYLFVNAAALAAGVRSICLPRSAPTVFQAVAFLVPLVIIYPLLLLSALESNQVMVPYSPFVFRSVPRLASAWIKYFLELFCLCGSMLFLAEWSANRLGWGAVPVLAVALATTLFIGARLTGRIGWYVLQNAEKVEPPSEEDGPYKPHSIELRTPI